MEAPTPAGEDDGDHETRSSAGSPGADERAAMAVHSWGEGPALVLFHGGMGSWRHWVRNVEPLARHFRVHAIDLPGYGDSPAVARDIAPADYFDLVHRALLAWLPGPAPFGVVAFSFGAVVASTVASRLGTRVRRMSLIGPSGFGPPRSERKLPTASYKLAADDPARLMEAMRQNLLAVMLLHPESIDDEVLQLQAENVRLHKGMNSRTVSVLDVVPTNLGAVGCPVQIIFGDSDQVARGALAERIERCRQVRPDAEVRVLPRTGHWAMFENAPAVNEALIAFHRSR